MSFDLAVFTANDKAFQYLNEITYIDIYQSLALPLCLSTSCIELFIVVDARKVFAHKDFYFPTFLYH